MIEKIKEELRWIKPYKLLGKGNKADGFFFGLGIIFNDLQGLRLLERDFREKYQKPDLNEPTVELGNYAGILIQIHRVAAGIINEFFIFLRKNNEIMTSPEVLEIIGSLTLSERDLWDRLGAISRGDIIEASDFLETLAIIRSNLSFHYDNSGKILKRGFSSYFFGESKKGVNERAYYLLDDIPEARFYFCDAAAQEAMYMAAGKQIKKLMSEDPSAEKYHSQITQSVVTINLAIRTLLDKFIKFRRNLPDLPN